MTERIQVVSEDDVPLFGLERNVAIDKGLWRRASGGLIFSPDAKHVLCHKRSQNKDERGGTWVATFGGKVLEDENSYHAAVRELKEEFGVEVGDESLSFFGKFRSEQRRQFEYVYWLRLDASICSIRAVDGEVDDWRWLSTKFLERSLNSDPRWYCYGYELSVIRHLDDITRPDFS